MERGFEQLVGEVSEHHQEDGEGPCGVEKDQPLPFRLGEAARAKQPCGALDGREILGDKGVPGSTCELDHHGPLARRYSVLRRRAAFDPDPQRRADFNQGVEVDGGFSHGRREGSLKVSAVVP